MNFHNRDSARLRFAIDAVRRECRTEDMSEVQRDRLAQLATIWASGYLEITCRELILSYAKQRCDASVSKYVGWNLARLRNPKVKRITEEIRKFDVDIAKELMRSCSGRISESVDSIVSLRNVVAHGGAASITLDGILDHFENALQFTAKIQELLAK